MVMANWGRWTLTAVLAAAAPVGGCGGTMAFSDSSALVITGDPPAPPPAPKPKPAPVPPPPKVRRVEVTADKIVIHDKILFEVNKSIIREESHGLLDEIAAVITEHAHIRKVSIEGHTDSDGSDAHNQTLSDGRARAVADYLIGRGVDAKRLSSKGFGEARPLASNETPEGKEKNRRVEFLITEQDHVKKTYEIDPKTGKRREIKEGT